MNSHLLWLLIYTVGITAFGVWIGRRVKGAADFFVAGRKLPPLLVGSTVLAANIGAGTTVGAAGLAYYDGISAWWWNGAAGIGTLILAFWVAPKLWAIAVRNDHLTVGDFLEHRYSATVRGVVAGLLLIGTLAILAAQLIAGAAVLEVVAGMPRWQGVAIGGIAMTIYFSAGGLLSSAWVNVVQLIVLAGGFVIALPMVLASVGGVQAIASAPTAPASYWDVMHSSGASSGWTMLILLTPSFIISPGLVGKAYGAESARAIRIGIGAAGVAQLLFSFLPVLLGMSARVHFPDIENPNLVLPTVLLHELPTFVGALALAAVFSAEVSTCDAILYMLATSSSKDLYQRLINRSATSTQILSVARAVAVVGGLLGMILAIQFATIVDALRVFYSLMGATLLVPVLGALMFRRATSRDAMAAIAGGVGALLAVYFGTSRKGWWDPSLWGLVGSTIAFMLSLLISSRTTPGTAPASGPREATRR
ncbi:MAG TPA: sodium:solute symporter family protein [Vicinamibacterales bacterium]|nr:sodium:solute symporter family protein [Vicinamibacterales bacterium]